MLVQGMARGLCSAMHTPKPILAPQPLLLPPDKNLGQLDKDKPSSSPATAVVASEGCTKRGAWCHHGAPHSGAPEELLQLQEKLRVFPHHRGRLL